MQMEIEDKWAANKSEYKGKRYFFCNLSDKKKIGSIQRKTLSHDREVK
jgi:YHS domain-containing protein